MGEGSTEFLMSLFDGPNDEPVDDGFDMHLTSGSGAASSSSWIPPAPAGRGLGVRGRRPPQKLPGGRGKFPMPYFDDGLDGDMSDDDLFMDEDSLDGSFSDEFLDDGLGLPPLRPQQPWRIIHRSNPFGRLQLPPVRRLRPGFSAQDFPTSLASALSPLDGSPLGKHKQTSKISAGPALSAPDRSPFGKRKQTGQSSAGKEPASSTIGETLSALPLPALAQSAASTEPATVDRPALSASSTSAEPLPVESALVPVSSSSSVTRPSQNAEDEALVPCLDKDLDVQGMPPRMDSGKRPADDEAADSRSPNKKSAKLKAQDSGAPAPPKFAFEWFRSTRKQETEELPVLIQQWKALAETERAEFAQMAERDRARFEQEHAEWSRRRAEAGEHEASAEDIMGHQQQLLDQDLAGMDPTVSGDVKPSKREAHKRAVALRKAQKLECQLAKQREIAHRKALRLEKTKRGSMPAGYPEKARSAYCLFCKDHKRKLSSERAAAVGVVVGAQADFEDHSGCKVLEVPENGSIQVAELGATEASQAPGNLTAQAAVVAGGGEEKAQEQAAPQRRSPLEEYRAAWDGLPEEERESFQVKAAADEQRFRAELEAWLAKEPDGGLGEAAEVTIRATARKRLSRPIAPQGPRTRLEPQEPLDPNSMDAVLRGAIRLKGPKEPKPEQAPAQVEGDKKSLTNGDGEMAGNSETNEIDDFWASFGVTATAASSSSDGRSGHVQPVASTGPSSGAMPTPHGVPAAFGPGGHEESVDDLLAGFGADPAEQQQENTNDAPAYEEESALANWQDPLLSWSDTPETAGPPQALGPQVCIDEDGNIVVKQSSLSTKIDSTLRPEDMVGPAVESVSEYKQAYKKTPITRWSNEETAQFYEALELYGMDLFLVQTFFRHKSASQIKTKYTKELKKNRAKVEEALTSKAKKLTKDAFEKQHGKIDTSKHYVPCPTPPPGEEPEPDGSLPGEDPDAMPDPMFPPEPEYTEEDESLTTNRLMALFD